MPRFAAGIWSTLFKIINMESIKISPMTRHYQKWKYFNERITNQSIFGCGVCAYHIDVCIMV